MRRDYGVGVVWECVAVNTVGRKGRRGSRTQENISVQDSMVLSEAEQKEGLPECAFWRCVAVDAQVRPALNLGFATYVRSYIKQVRSIDDKIYRECGVSFGTAPLRLVRREG